MIAQKKDKKNMKRRILAAILTIMMTGTMLIGCGRNSEDSPPDSGNTVKETAEEDSGIYRRQSEYGYGGTCKDV